MKSKRRIAVIKSSDVNLTFITGVEIEISGKVWLTDCGNLSTPHGLIEKDRFYIVEDPDGLEKIEPFEVF